MESKRYTLTIRLPVTIMAEPGIDPVAAVADVFQRDTWSDGRHDYARELAVDGLGRVVREAVHCAAERHFASIHGRNAMEDYTTPGGSKGRRNLAMHLAGEWCRDVYCAVDAAGWQASIEPTADD